MEAKKHPISLFLCLSWLAENLTSKIFWVFLFFPKIIQEFWELKSHETSGITSVLASIMTTNEMKLVQTWMVFWRVGSFVAHRIHSFQVYLAIRNVLGSQHLGPYSSFPFLPQVYPTWFLPSLKRCVELATGLYQLLNLASFPFFSFMGPNLFLWGLSIHFLLNPTEPFLSLHPLKRALLSPRTQWTLGLQDKNIPLKYKATHAHRHTYD